MTFGCGIVECMKRGNTKAEESERIEYIKRATVIVEESSSTECSKTVNVAL